MYTDIIREALEKLSENLIYVYGFHKQHDNVDVLKQDCVINLYETLHKFDASKGHRAFSYFNVVAKHWLIIHSRKKNKRQYRMVSIDDPDNEWIEFYNPGPQNISLNGWRITSGIDFSFPDIIIEPDTYIIVAANPLKFSMVHPDVSNALGPWIGKLSNNGETIRLRGNNNVEVDQVDYADEGFWAVRMPGDDDLGHEGWTWDAKHLSLIHI